jgi:8-oxo-dGTP diphosphatase
VASVPKRPGLPRTVELESGEFVWCTPAEPGDEPSPLSDRVSSLLQALH